MAKKKSKTGIIVLIGGITLVIAGIAWKVMTTPKRVKTPTNPKDKPTELPSKNGQTPATNTTAPVSVPPATDLNSFPLTYGSRGSRVKQLQTALNTLGASPQLVVDGIFGAKTEEATLNQTMWPYVSTQEDLDAIINDANNMQYINGSQVDTSKPGWSILSN